MLAIDYEALAEPDLIARARGGDHKAFRAIMQANNQRLFRIARSVLGDEAEAEDVVQEAYVRAFSHLADFRGEARLSTWLTQIALNEARGRLRKRRPQVSVEAIEAAQAQGQVIMFPKPSAAPNPENEAARAQVRRLVEAGIDELPEPFRLVFMLREIEECSVEETGAQLGIPAETVKTRLFRARRLLRKALANKLGASVAEAFPFLGARCNAITEAVLARLAAG